MLPRWSALGRPLLPRPGWDDQLLADLQRVRVRQIVGLHDGAHGCAIAIGNIDQHIARLHHMYLGTMGLGLRRGRQESRGARGGGHAAIGIGGRFGHAFRQREKQRVAGLKDGRALTILHGENFPSRVFVANGLPVAVAPPLLGASDQLERADVHGVRAPVRCGALRTPETRTG